MRAWLKRWPCPKVPLQLFTRQPCPVTWLSTICGACPSPRQPWSALVQRPPGARQAEVADLEVAGRVEQQVAGLEVAVQHVGRVHKLEAAQHLRRAAGGMQGRRASAKGAGAEASPMGTPHRPSCMHAGVRVRACRPPGLIPACAAADHMHRALSLRVPAACCCGRARPPPPPDRLALAAAEETRPCASPRTWYTKYWKCSFVSGWLLRMIWCRSVSMSSYTRYTSLNLSLDGGRRMSLTAMMFSCRRCRSSLISRSVRRASVRFSNALAIFLIATFSLVCRFLALRGAAEKGVPGRGGSRRAHGCRRGRA